MNRKNNQPNNIRKSIDEGGKEPMEIMKNQRITPRGISIGACGIRHLESAHFYTGVPPVSVRPPGACPLHEHAGGQGSRRKQFCFSVSVQGLNRPCAAVRLSQVRMSIAAGDIHPSHHFARKSRAAHHEGG